MAQPLQNITVAAPGFFGLNTQESPIGLDPSYASIADNCVIDKLGRIAARKGYKTITTNGAAVLGTSRGIEVVFEFISRAGVTTVFSCGNNKIFTGTTTLTEVTLPVGYTISDNNWKVMSFNNDVYFYQKGHQPLLSVAGTSTLAVQSTGSDLFFLSSRGVMSLGRVVQEKSLPLNDISKNVRSDLLQTLSQENHANGHREAIKSIYSPIDAFYLITFPDSSLVYCFDLRQALENGAYRATTWTAIKPISFSIFADDHLYMGHDEGIVEYATYLDGTTKYQMRYFSNPLDFGNASNLKFLKKFNVTIIGGQNTESTLNWGYDYTSDYTKQALTFGTASAAEYGVTEYNTTGEYTASIVIQTPKVNTSGNGEVVTIGIEAEVNDSPFSIQKIDIHALLGRLI